MNYKFSTFLRFVIEHLDETESEEKSKYNSLDAEKKKEFLKTLSDEKILILYHSLKNGKTKLSKLLQKVDPKKHDKLSKSWNKRLCPLSEEEECVAKALKLDLFDSLDEEKKKEFLKTLSDEKILILYHSLKDGRTELFKLLDPKKRNKLSNSLNDKWLCFLSEEEECVAKALKLDLSDSNLTTIIKKKIPVLKTSLESPPDATSATAQIQDAGPPAEGSSTLKEEVENLISKESLAKKIKLPKNIDSEQKENFSKDVVRRILFHAGIQHVKKKNETIHKGEFDNLIILPRQIIGKFSEVFIKEIFVFFL